MIKIYKYTAAFAMVMALAGCGKSFLTKSPLSSVNTDNFYKTESDAIAAINAAYQPLQRPKLYNLRMWTSDIMAGNSATGGANDGSDGIETIQESNFTTQPDNAGVLDLYRGPAPGILQCNIVLQKVPSISMDPATKSRILGEAQFLRGLYYFILVRYFGDVPLILVPQDPTNKNEIYPVRTPKAQVYTQIITDLTNAMNNLPLANTYTGANIGRASKGSAAGMLASVYLTMGQYQKCADLCQQVSTMGYSLNADYADNFNPAKKNGVESLFEVQYTGLTTFGFFDDRNQASWATTFMGPRNQAAFAAGGGYGWNLPTQEFIDSYESGDKRKDETVLYQGCPAFGGADYISSYSLTGYNVRKFLVPITSTSAYNTSPEDFPVMRYADVLLMWAESLNELGQTSAAEAPLNLVRTRAGLGNITSGLSKDDFRTAVLHERRIELAFEGQRWFDLIRINNGQYGLDFLHSIGKTNATSKNLILPIPQQEIDANPNLKQNPGY